MMFLYTETAYSSDFATLQSEVTKIAAHSLEKNEWNKFTTLSVERKCSDFAIKNVVDQLTIYFEI